MRPIDDGEYARFLIPSEARDLLNRLVGQILHCVQDEDSLGLTMSLRKERFT